MYITLSCELYFHFLYKYVKVSSSYPMHIGYKIPGFLYFHHLFAWQFLKVNDSENLNINLQ